GSPRYGGPPQAHIMRFTHLTQLALVFVAFTCGTAAKAQEVPPPEASVVAPLEGGAADLESLGDAFRELLVPHGMTADVAAELAKARAPAMRKAEAGVDVASARAKEARTSFFGRAEIGYRYTRIKKIENPTIFQAPAIDPADLDALVAGVSDPNAQALLGSYVQLLNGLSSASFPILQNRQALYASYL